MLTVGNYCTVVGSTNWSWTQDSVVRHDYLAIGNFRHVLKLVWQCSIDKQPHTYVIKCLPNVATVTTLRNLCYPYFWVWRHIFHEQSINILLQTLSLGKTKDVNKVSYYRSVNLRKKEKCFICMQNNQPMNIKKRKQFVLTQFLLGTVSPVPSPATVLNQIDRLTT